MNIKTSQEINTYKMKVLKLVPLISILGIISACNNDVKEFRASGVFETTEVIVSSEANGKLLAFDTQEGETLKKDVVVCQIDSSTLKLQLKQVEAAIQALEASKPNMRVQIEATEKEIEKQEFEKKRLEKLLEGDVATQKQLDDINAMLTILRSRLRSQKSTLATSIRSIDAQIETQRVQIEQLRDQIAKCRIKAPISGTVLVKYSEAGEMTGIGKPLLKLADIDHMILRAYVTADQLASLQLGQDVKVYAEFGAEEQRDYTGKIAWISSKSEFTPKTIQTQDERANLVYAVKVSVPNDGYLKIGMYGGFTL